MSDGERLSDFTTYRLKLLDELIDWLPEEQFREFMMQRTNILKIVIGEE